MSKRLQVLLGDREMREIQRAAKRRGMTVSEWVRTSLRKARESEPRDSVKQKLSAIRAAAAHQFPAPDVDEMNAEIVRGYSTGWEP